jgi:hypothetical protein
MAGRSWCVSVGSRKVRLDKVWQGGSGVFWWGPFRLGRVGSVLARRLRYVQVWQGGER